jgi:5'-deoxynucleotidase YfbR-like HD superfamily hydrolase
MFKPIDFSAFPKEREEKLKQIYRYSLFEHMMYRSSVWDHTHRVLWLAEEILPIAEKYLKLDVEKVRALALVHDDEEMITGDIPGGVKFAMSEEEKKKLLEKENIAADELAQKYPKEVHGYSYRALLKHSAHKDCLEAQLVSYLDKADAYGESLHELYAGNSGFLLSVVFYDRVLQTFAVRYPNLQPLLSAKGLTSALLLTPLPTNKIETKNYTHFNKAHSKESLLAETDIPFYNIWRRVILERGGEKYLLDQKEFLSQ